MKPIPRRAKQSKRVPKKRLYVRLPIDLYLYVNDQACEQDISATQVVIRLLSEAKKTTTGSILQNRTPLIDTKQRVN